MSTKENKGKQGFASMSRQKRCTIASKGGKAAWALGTAHRFTSEQAKQAGKKGGSRSTPRSAKKEEVA